MGKFGWDYPAGCTSVPGDEDVMLPRVGEIVLLDDLRGIVVGVWTAQDIEVPEWADEGAVECVLVGFLDERTPRVVDVMGLIPDDGPLVKVDVDHSESVGLCSDTTGVAYFNLAMYGGQWWGSALWDGHHATETLFEDLGPYPDKKQATVACIDAGYDAISNSEWWSAFEGDELTKLEDELSRQQIGWHAYAMKE